MLSPKARLEAAIREYLKSVTGLTSKQILISRDKDTQDLPRIELDAQLNTNDGFQNTDPAEKLATLDMRVVTGQNSETQEDSETFLRKVATAMDDGDAIRDAVNAPADPVDDQRTILNIHIYSVSQTGEDADQSTETNTTTLTYEIPMRTDDGLGEDTSNSYVEDGYVSSYLE